ncbi:MAG TPA: hypothetical protein VI256_04610 [Roseiarcus sp.]
MHLGLLQRNILGDDFGNTAHPGLGDAIAVKQGVGGDGKEANCRERRDAQRQSQLQIDGAREARHEIKGLLHAVFLSPSHLEADSVEKKAPQAKIGHFTRSIRGKSPFRARGGWGGMGTISFS